MSLGTDFPELTERHLVQQVVVVDLQLLFVRTNAPMCIINDSTKSQLLGFSFIFLCSFSDETCKATPRLPNSKLWDHLTHYQLHHFLKRCLLIATFYHNRPCPCLLRQRWQADGNRSNLSPTRRSWPLPLPVFNPSGLFLYRATFSAIFVSALLFSRNILRRKS